MKRYTLRRTLLALSVTACLIPAYAQSQSTGDSSMKSPSTSGSSESTSPTSPSTSGSSSMKDSHSGTMTSPGTTGSSSGTGSSMGSSGSSSMGGSTSTSTSPSVSDASGAMTNDIGLTETDRALNNQIRNSLKADSSLNNAGQKLSLRSDNGVVTLNGTVATEKDKQDLETKIKDMAGVKDVENNLQISPQASSSSSSSTTTTTR